jgi:hypothetical protein
MQDVPRKAVLLSPMNAAGALKYLLDHVVKIGGKRKLR